ncbi:MAG TPA: winged helix-turn-helix domain-containing protein, partial [Blastocatellia bacterium]|nr:winged helix-turn-helix domain-containing protein [Blastocatellia bacterium]
MAIPQPTKRFYEFGPFRINSIQRVLLREGEVVVVTPKQFDLLLLLVENHGRVVEKERLIEEIWPETAVEEGNLTTNIYMLRKVLGEDINGQQYIQTLPRRGYRFVGEVREVAAGDGRPGVKEPVELHLVTRQEQEAVLPREALARGGWARLGAKWRLAVAGFALVAVTAAVVFYYIWSKPNPTVKTIAVLPFKPLVSDNRDEALELGIAETLINKLSGIKQLVVRPMSSVRKYSALDQEPVAAGRELGVDYVLESNLQMIGEKTRATMYLWSVKEGAVVWTDKCD